jgi:phosphate transport system substrate-binding protein
VLRTRMRRAVVAAVAATCLAVPSAAAAKPVITMSGSTSVAPLAALLASKYLKVCHHCVSFKLLQGGSDVGVADVAAGRVTIGNSSRDPKPSDPGGLVFHKIARDAICIISNSSNGVPNLSQNQIQAVFGGATRSWGDVPGSTKNGTIDVYVRTPASGTQDAFQKIFMGSTKVFSGASEKASNGLIQAGVTGDDSGIGYVSLAFTSGVNNIAYNGVSCDLRNAKSGQYGGLRNFYMVTRGPAVGAAKKWIKWITHSSAASRVIATDWVPIH